MQLLIVLLLAVAASATNYGYSYAPSYTGYGGYDTGVYGYSNYGGYGSSLYGAPYTYGSSYAYAPESYYGGSTYVAPKAAISYVSKPATTYVAPAIQKYAAPTYSYVSQPVSYVAEAPQVQKYVAPAVSYVSKPAVTYVAAAPKVEKFLTVPSYYGSLYNGQKPADRVRPSTSSFALGKSNVFPSSNRKGTVDSTRKATVPKAPAHVPKPEPIYTQTKVSKTVPSTPVQEPFVEVSQRRKTSHHDVAPVEESFSTHQVKSGSKVSIGDQTYVVVPVEDYQSNKQSVFSHHTFSVDDKSSTVDGSFFPFPSDAFAPVEFTGYKYPAVSPLLYSSDKALEIPGVSYVYNVEQPAVASGSYGAGYGQANPSSIVYGLGYTGDKASGISYGSEYTGDKASGIPYGSEYSGDKTSDDSYVSEYNDDKAAGDSYGSEYDDGKAPVEKPGFHHRTSETLYSPEHRQSNSGHSEDKAPDSKYGSDTFGDEDSAVSYGSDYSGGIGSVDSYSSNKSGVKTSKGIYA